MLRYLATLSCLPANERDPNARICLAIASFGTAKTREPWDEIFLFSKGEIQRGRPLTWIEGLKVSSSFFIFSLPFSPEKGEMGAA
jgi:hypothetical protein